MPSSPDNLIERLRAGLEGRYAVERELGRGGMAIVFLARDLRLARQVAIKVLHPDLATSLGAERFLLEIRTTAQIVHPHVLPLHDSGEMDGLLYYVMPYVAGESLADRLEREGALPIPAAVAIAREVADGLAHAHALDVVHRDIKPGNILLSGGNHASIADFGLARALHAATNARLTSTGISIGSPLYMSPEQIGGASVIDGRADVYGLGCMLFEMLAGRAPFEGTDVGGVLRKHLLDPPPSLRDAGVAAPEALEEAVRRCLAKDPADRPTAAELLRVLESVDRAGASSALPAAGPRWTSLRSALRRAGVRDRVAMAGVGAVLAVGAAIGGWWVFGRGGEAEETGLEPAHIAVLYFEDHSPAQDLGYLASGLTDGLIQALTEVQALEVVSRNGVKQFQGKAVPADSIARALGVGSIVEGSVTRSADRVRVNVQLVDAGTSTQLVSRQVEAPLGEVFALQDTLVRQVAQLLRQALGREIRLRQTRRGTNNPRAWELIQRADALRDDFLAVRVSDAEAARRLILRADSVAASAVRLDPRWSYARVFRGWLARDLARLAADLPGRLEPAWGARALAQADTALILRPDDPAAYELRGVLEQEAARGAEGADRKALASRAEADLQRAVALDDRRARAWWALSELVLDQGRFYEAKVAAERALRADAFLENPGTVLHQIYYSAAQLGPGADAIRPCNEGRQRFPTSSRFIVCQLFILASFPSEAPDLTRALALRDSLTTVVPPNNREEFRSFGTMLAAQVAARAGLRDTALALIREARGDTVVDWLSYNEAHAHLLLGDRQQSIALLGRYLEFDPDTAFLARDWWFRDLHADPRFRRLVGEAAPGGP